MDLLTLLLKTRVLIRAAELGCCCYLLWPLKKRFSSLAANIAFLLGFAGLMGLARLLVYTIPHIESEFVYINFVYYPLLFMALRLQYRISARDALYYILLIFLCAHIPRQLLAILFHYTNESGLFPTLLYTAAFSAVVLVSFRIVKKYVYRIADRCFTWKQLLSMFLGVLPVLLVTNIGLFTELEQTRLPVSVVCIAYLCGLCGLTLVIRYDNAIMLSRKEQELSRMEAMLMSQHQQYLVKKEAMDVINHKYHDLKNHLLYLNTESDQEKRNAYIKSLTEEIRAYESLRPTGNEALDIIIASKGLECAQKGVRLLLLLDGSRLDFMKPLDITTIFGNAMDNAIEALAGVDEAQRELIVRMSVKRQWLALRFENPYSGELVWEGNAPRSTKAGEEHHGIGIKSIRYTAERYGGNLTLEAKGGVFVMNLLFPLSTEKAQ